MMKTSKKEKTVLVFKVVIIQIYLKFYLNTKTYYLKVLTINLK